jgi:hypothetical protein
MRGRRERRYVTYRCDRGRWSAPHSTSRRHKASFRNEFLRRRLALARSTVSPARYLTRSPSARDTAGAPHGRCHGHGDMVCGARRSRGRRGRPRGRGRGDRSGRPPRATAHEGLHVRGRPLACGGTNRQELPRFPARRGLSRRRRDRATAHATALAWARDPCRGAAGVALPLVRPPRTECRHRQLRATRAGVHLGTLRRQARSRARRCGQAALTRTPIVALPY